MNHAPVRPLLPTLEFTTRETNWGLVFRLGTVRGSGADAELIAQAMRKAGP